MNTTCVLGSMFCLDIKREKEKVLSGENSGIK